MIHDTTPKRVSRYDPMEGPCPLPSGRSPVPPERSEWFLERDFDGVCKGFVRRTEKRTVDRGGVVRGVSSFKVK